MALKKLDDTHKSIYKDDELPDDIISKNVAITIVCVVKGDCKCYQ